MPGPGRNKTPVALLFKEISSHGKVPRVKCNFCSAEVAKNGTRMLAHISKCLKCDEQVKMKYINQPSVTSMFSRIILFQ